MEKIRKFQDILARLTLAVASIMTLSVAVAIFASVVGRFAGVGLFWVEQFSRYMLIWSVFMAANVLIYRNELMRVAFMDAFWPAKVKQVREAIYTVIFIVMLFILCREGMIQANSFIGVSLMGINVDKFWVYLSVPVGAALMMVQYLLNLFVSLYDVFKGGDKDSRKIEEKGEPAS